DTQIGFELLCYSLVGAITALNIQRSSLRKPTPLEIVLFIYGLYALASVAWSYDPTISVVRATQLLILLAFIFTAIRVLNPVQTLYAMGVTVTLAVLGFAFLAAVVPGANGARTDFYGYSRFTWFAVHPIEAANEAGIALVFVSSIALHLTRSWRTRFFGLPLWLVAALLALILLQTRTRTALVAVAVALAVMFGPAVLKHGSGVLTGGNRSPITRLLMLAGAVVGAAVVLRFAGALHPREMFLQTVYRGESSSQLTGLNGRAELWAGLMQLSAQRPLTGYGFVASRSVLLSVLPWAGEAHNAFLETLLDLGLVGVLLLWVPLVFCIVRPIPASIRISRPTYWAFALAKTLLIYFVVEGMTDQAFANFAGYSAAATVACLLACDMARTTYSNAPRRLYGATA
ncbi:MAG: O-antigen ligase family protein, partial [Candidatus Binataceae bacterium]